MLRSSLLRHEMSRPLAGGRPLTFAGLCGLLVAPKSTRRHTRLMPEEVVSHRLLLLLELLPDVCPAGCFRILAGL